MVDFTQFNFDDVAETKQIDDSIFALRGDLDGYEVEDYEEINQFIGVVVGKEEYLLNINSVKEINMLSKITFVPSAPKNVSGVINIRGNILPAISLRELMGLENVSPNQSSRIIIVEQCGEVFGLIVDGIAYVAALNNSDIEANVKGSSQGSELLQGIGSYKEKMLGVLDVEKIHQAVAPDIDGDNNEDEN